MIPKELLESLNLHDAKDIKMAQNMWKMLDDMADSNPQDYQSFINKNLKQGIADIKQERQKKEQPLKITPQIGFLLQCQANLKQIGETQFNEKFKVSQKAEQWQKVKLKFKTRVQIYLNVCFSNRVILPLDKDKNEISQLSNTSISKIVAIPFSLQEYKLSEDGKTIFFLLVLNDQVFIKLKQINPSYLINMAYSLLQQRIKTDKNPLLSLYNARQYPDKLVFYEIIKESIRLNKQTHFKFFSLSKPEKILLQSGADKQQSQDVNKSSSKEQIKFKQNNNEDVKLPQLKFELPSQPNKQNSKKVMVEEIRSTTEQQNKIPYTLTKGQKEYKAEFLVVGIQSIKEVQLDVNTRCIKVNIPKTNKSRQLDLDKAINVDLVKAKYVKKENKLNVAMPLL